MLLGEGHLLGRVKTLLLAHICPPIWPQAVPRPSVASAILTSPDSGLPAFLVRPHLGTTPLDTYHAVQSRHRTTTRGQRATLDTQKGP